MIHLYCGDGKGKTTALRDVIRRLSDGISEINFRGMTCGVVDERGEIAAVYLGKVSLDVGERTDIMSNCKKDIGYSKAWLHHKGRNKHHFQYWYDYAAPIKTPIMPFKYFLEMICDDLAAGMTYQGKKWYPGYQLTYWNKVREEAKMNETMKQLLDKVYTEISLHGLKVLKRKQIKEWYDSYIK